MSASLLLTLATALAFAQAQETINQSHQSHVTCRGNLCSLDQVGNNGNQVHSAANVFEKEIGEQLRAGKALKVANPRVHLWVWQEKGQDLFEIRWTVKLVPTDLAHADHHFARLGTLLEKKTLAEAEGIVKMQMSEKVQGLSKKLKKPVLECAHDYTKGSKESWYIEECFAAWP